MPESRDRLLRRRPDDATLFFPRPIRDEEGQTSLHIQPDEPEVSTFRWGSTALNGSTIGVAAGRVNGVGRGSFGTPSPRPRNERGGGGGTSTVRRRPRRSLLPSWYPRKPLQDITPIVKAIERRRARLREVEGLQLTSPLPQGQIVHTPSVPAFGAPLEHDPSMIFPSPTVGIRHCPRTVGKVPKILLDITKQSDGQSDFLTPEKRLLNSIDKVEKVVMEELNRLKRTPAAKKAEREKKVRTLMSMR